MAGGTVKPFGDGSFSRNDGYKTSVAGKGSSTDGIGTVANADGQSVVGTYNVPDPDAAFIVGNGTSDENRNNALMVMKDGTIRNSAGSILPVAVNIDDIIGYSFGTNFRIHNMFVRALRSTSSVGSLADSSVCKIIASLFRGLNAMSTGQVILYRKTDAVDDVLPCYCTRGKSYGVTCEYDDYRLHIPSVMFMDPNDYYIEKFGGNDISDGDVLDFSIYARYNSTDNIWEYGIYGLMHAHHYDKCIDVERVFELETSPWDYE